MERIRTNEKQSIKSGIGILPSINDLREKEFRGESLTSDERVALCNYDKFRIAELNKQSNDNAFHKRYRELQVMANLGDYREFLKEKYSEI